MDVGPHVWQEDAAVEAKVSDPKGPTPRDTA